MTKKTQTKNEKTLTACEKAATQSKTELFVFRIYISGTTPQSQRAVRNLHTICEKYLSSRFELEIIDIYQTPARAKEDQILAVPTLVWAFTLSTRQILGDLSNQSRVLASLGLLSATR